MSGPARLLVIGSPGSGKSTFARALAAATGLPPIHLDQLYWLPGWVEPDREHWQTSVTALLAAPRWIIDGNYSSSLLPRIAAAEIVVVLDLPTWLCLWRVVRRVVHLRGEVRPDMATGCPERHNLAFLWYVARFRRTKHPRIAAALSAFGGRMVWLRGSAAADVLIEVFRRS